MERFVLILCIVCMHYISDGYAQTSPSHKNSIKGIDRVAYVSFKPGNWDIYQIGGSSRKALRLTSHPSLEYNAVFSPNGKWVVFCSERNGNPDLFVLDLENPLAIPQLLVESDALEDQVSFSPDGSQIAFVSTITGNADIYLLPFEPNVTQSIKRAINVTNHPQGDFRPAFSPNGKQIAFSSDRNLPIGNTSPLARTRSGDIYVMDIKGENLKRLTTAKGWDGSPFWSPNGKRIVFYSQRERKLTPFGSFSNIWVMEADGAHQRMLVPNDSMAISPIFGPNGRIYYANGSFDANMPVERRDRASHWQIVSVDSNGTDRKVELDSTQNFWEPSLHPQTHALLVHGPGPIPEDANRSFGEGPLSEEGSPFRKKLSDREIDLYPMRTFTCMIHPLKNDLLYSSPPGPNLYLSRIDGSGVESILQMDPPQAIFMGFSWSKDGQWVAYTKGNHFSGPSAEADVWKMTGTGNDRINLTPDSPGNDGFPSFSGDGKQIVFRSGRTGDFEIFLMNSDGSSPRNLTEHPANDIFPAFSPVKNQVAFVSDRDSLGSRIYEVYLMDLDKNGEPMALKRITHNEVQEGHLEFSLDGQWLFYTTEQGGICDEEPMVKAIIFAPQMYGEIYAYNLISGQTLRLTHNKWEEGFPSVGAPIPNP